MASFTPSSLSVQSMGSTKLTMATINANILSGTDYWTSGITDIKSIVGSVYGYVPDLSSGSGFSITWTASTGTIHIIKFLASSGSGLMLWISSGGPS